jgi:DNA-binding CsgD family transcriptional regulator
MISISHPRSIHSVIDDIKARIDKWFSDINETYPQLDDIDDPVYLKDHNSRLTHANSMYIRFFLNGETQIGQPTRMFLDQSLQTVSKHSDQMIFNGVTALSFDHYGNGPNNAWYQFTTYKFDLRSYGQKAFSILGISRPIAFEGTKEQSSNAIEIQFHLFDELPAESQRVMKLISTGLSTKEIASLMDLSKRTIDNRKSEMMKLFGLQNTIELAVLLVRFEERGLLTID